MIETNKDKLVKMAVAGEVNHPSARRGYRVDFEGTPQIGLGMSGVKYNVALGDPTYGMEEEEHVEPGVSISNKNKSEARALGVLGCIGNEVKVTSGEAKGVKGRITGKHGAFLVHFNQQDKENIIPGDKVLVKAWGTGLKINGFEESVRVNKIDPDLLQKMGISVEDGKLVVPVANQFPAYMMGSGYGMWPVTIDYDIQTTCPEVFDEFNLKKIRFGDVVCLHDQLNWYGRGYYEGAVTIGVVVHGWSKSSGHGPGVTTILSSRDGTIVPRMEASANIAEYLGLTSD